MVSDNIRGCAVGALAATHPEVAALLIPNAITGAFQPQVVGQFCHGFNLGMRLQCVEGSGEDWFLALTLRMAETRQQRLAVEHNCSIRCGYQIGETRLWFDELAFTSSGLRKVCSRTPESVLRRFFSEGKGEKAE